MALITAKNLSQSFGLAPLLDHVSVNIQPRSRVALIGRNGAGKSTLMKILAGKITPDDGEIVKKSTLVTGYFDQEVPEGISGSVFDVVAEALQDIRQTVEKFHQLSAELAEADASQQDKLNREIAKVQAKIDQANGWELDYQIEQVISQLELEATATFSELSGGKKRRVMLAKSLVQKPDVLFLDEPTNHLDVESIEYLEKWFQDYTGTIVFVSHDRSFIDALATEIVEIDRGNVQVFPGNYQTYLKRKADMLAAEETENANFDKKLAEEETWIRQGIKARRTRNEGRVRALQALRKEHAERRKQEKSANITISEADRSSRIIAKTHNVSLQFGDKTLFSGLETTIVRGDKIGIIGPNGVGKSSLIKVLLGEIEPTAGKIKYGMNLQIGYLDQLRDTLQDKLSIIDNIREGSDFVEVNGKPKHIMSYMQEFLFSPERIRTPVGALSGGERNRVLLAKLFTKPINVLVMDEPTNDLDIDTLEVLESILVDFQGTLLLISHDRTFLDNIVTQTLVFENGNVNEYVGGYQDWLRQRPEPVVQKTLKPKKTAEEKVEKTKSQPIANPESAGKKLSYQEQRELSKLPNQIDKLEKTIAELGEKLADPDVYSNPEKATELGRELQQKQSELDALMDRWMELEG